MKKILLTAAIFSFSVSAVFGQMKSVNSALSESKAEKPDYKSARASLKEAFKNPESKDQAKTWYTAGALENRYFDEERNKIYLKQNPNEKEMYTALDKVYTYFLEAVKLDTLPNEKGKVKPKYLKEIKTKLRAIQTDFINGGAYFYDKKDFKQAYKQFKNYLDIPKLGFMATEKIPADTNYVKIKFYAALAATQLKDSKLAIAAFEDLKNDNYESNQVYQYLIYEYDQINDTINKIRVLKEGAEKFPKENFYVQNLINMYIYTNQPNEAISYLDKAIAQDPKNVQYWNVKGGLYENLKNEDMAVECFQKAMDIDPNFTEAIGSMGRIYFNRAIKINDEISRISDQKAYIKARNERLRPMFEKARPYFEKAHSLKPEDKDYIIALRGIYYNLDMGDKLKEVEDKLNK